MPQEQIVPNRGESKEKRRAGEGEGEGGIHSSYELAMKLIKNSVFDFAVVHKHLAFYRKYLDGKCFLKRVIGDTPYFSWVHFIDEMVR